MALTCGFFNSETGTRDRRYNALQMSSIFDGIINDGIFMSIGDCLTITSDGIDMFVTVGTGRAWFNHTWTLNDAPFLLEIERSELFHDRYDAVVLEINHEREVRANTIKVIKGEPSYKPVYPELIHTATVNQYPLAYIYVKEGVELIRQADITSMVGHEPCPYITGILETVDIENMVAQWEDQWRRFYEEYTDDMNRTAKYWKDLWHEWYHMYTDSSTEEFSNWFKEQEATFKNWFDDLQVMLEDDVATNLAKEVELLKMKVCSLEKFESDLSEEFAIYKPIQDSDSDAVRDSEGHIIDGQIIFELKGMGCCGSMNMEECNTGCCDVEEDLHHLTNKVLNNTAGITALRGSLGKAEEHISDLESNIRYAEDTIDNLKVALSTIAADTVKNTESISKMEETNNNIAVRIVSIESGLDVLTKHAILDDDYDANDKETSTDMDRLESLQGSMKNAESNIDQLKKDVSSLETNMTDLENRAITKTKNEEDGD